MLLQSVVDPLEEKVLRMYPVASLLAIPLVVMGCTPFHPQLRHRPFHCHRCLLIEMKE